MTPPNSPKAVPQRAIQLAGSFIATGHQPRQEDLQRIRDAIKAGKPMQVAEIFAGLAAEGCMDIEIAQVTGRSRAERKGAIRHLEQSRYPSNGFVRASPGVHCSPGDRGQQAHRPSADCNVAGSHRAGGKRENVARPRECAGFGSRTAWGCSGECWPNPRLQVRISSTDATATWRSNAASQRRSHAQRWMKLAEPFWL